MKDNQQHTNEAAPDALLDVLSGVGENGRIEQERVGHFD